MANHTREEGHHGKPTVLQFLHLHGLHALGILGQLQRVEAQITRLPVHLANPGVLREELALDDHGESRNLSNAQAYDTLGVVVALLQGLIPRSLWVARDVRGALCKDPNNC